MEVVRFYFPLLWLFDLCWAVPPELIHFAFVRHFAAVCIVSLCSFTEIWDISIFFVATCWVQEWAGRRFLSFFFFCIFSSNCPKDCSFVTSSRNDTFWTQQECTAPLFLTCFLFLHTCDNHVALYIVMFELEIVDILAYQLVPVNPNVLEL